MNLSAVRGRIAFILVGAAVLVVAALVVLWQTPSAQGNPDHFAGDYFLFAKASYGKFAEANCDGTNDGQAEISGSTNDIYGRVHSNADLKINGTSNDFFDTSSPNPEVTYGTFDEDCMLDAGSGNNYFGGGPSDIDTIAYQVDATNGWPGNLGTFLDSNNLTYTNTTSTKAVGIDCDVGDLTLGSNYTIVPATDENKVICSGAGKITLDVSGVGTSADHFTITMLSHGTIEVSSQNSFLEPKAHGILAWTDEDSNTNDVSIKLAGSDTSIAKRAILFSPRSGQDYSGSDDATLCIQAIGQGINKVPGSTSTFGPFIAGCPLPSATLTVNKVCVPTSDGGKFNLLIGASIEAPNAPCGTGTGAVTVAIGTHIVSETAGTSTSLGDYTTVISGACNPSTGSVTLAAGQNKICTITNTLVSGPTPTPPPVGGLVEIAVPGTGANETGAGTALFGLIFVAFVALLSTGAAAVRVARRQS